MLTKKEIFYYLIRKAYSDSDKIYFFFEGQERGGDATGLLDLYCIPPNTALFIYCHVSGWSSHQINCTS